MLPTIYSLFVIFTIILFRKYAIFTQRLVLYFCIAACIDAVMFLIVSVCIGDYMLCLRCDYVFLHIDTVMFLIVSVY